MGERRYIRVFGDMARHFGMISGDYRSVSAEAEATIDGATLHCLYLLQDLDGGCRANCAYCTQGSSSTHARKESYLINKHTLRYPLKRLTDMVADGFIETRGIKRICISALHHEDAKEDLLAIVKAIRSVSPVRITGCYIPDTKESYRELKDAGADRLSINIEAATEDLFERYRGRARANSPYTWQIMNEAIDDAVEVYGRGHIGTHLLVGLGETHEQALNQVQSLYDRGVDVSLFAFAPVPDTDLADREPVAYWDFHRVQLGRYLMLTRRARFEDMTFDSSGEVTGYGIDGEALNDLIESGQPFRNGGGCPDCNRIYYETDVDQRYYNYPREPRAEEMERIKLDLQDVC